MPGPRFVDGDPVSLHTVESEDVAFYQRGWTEPELRLPLSVERPFNREATESFLEDVDDRTDVTLLACVEDEADDDQRARTPQDGRTRTPYDEQTSDTTPTPVGCVSMFGVDADSGAGSLAYWIAPEYQGEGYGAAAVDALLGYAFDERRLHRLTAFVLDGNDASRGLLEHLGFAHEGVHREQTVSNGERIDAHIYGLLDREWRERRESRSPVGTETRGPA